MAAVCIGGIIKCADDAEKDAIPTENLTPGQQVVTLSPAASYIWDGAAYQATSGAGGGGLSLSQVLGAIES